MYYDPQKHQRRSIRLPGYSYSEINTYCFITICIQNRACLLGDIKDMAMRLSSAGEMVQKVWKHTPEHYPVALDAFVIMPNHFHAIVIIGTDASGRPLTDEKIVPLAQIVGRFKTLTTHLYIEGVTKSGWPRFRNRLWQRNYFEHVIRNEESLNRLREYCQENPARWSLDHENPEAQAAERDVPWEE